MSISYLPGELITEILTRFPVKSITQFKCVSKSWCSLISSTHFVKFHLNRIIHDANFRSNRILLSTYPLISLDYEAFSNNRPDYSTNLEFITSVLERDGFDYSFECQVDIVGSCHGLLCLLIDYVYIVICNPSIREFVKVPKGSVLERDGFDYGYRFGYDSSVDDYKLVRFVEISDENIPGKMPVEMFSLRSTSWSSIGDVQFTTGVKESGAFSNGVLHWLVKGKILGENVSFDLETEVFSGSVWLPHKGEDGSASLFKLDVLQGCLWMDENLVNPELRARKEYGGDASSVISVFDNIRDDVEYTYWIEPICSTKNGEIVMDADGRELVMYNSQESRFRKIAMDIDCDWFQTSLYVETLVSPRICQGRH